MRRIEVQAEDDAKQVFTIAPSFVMPYMTGYTQDVEDALFLRKFDVPYWALARVYRNVLDYLVEACEAANWGRKVSSLLPIDEATPG